MPRRHLRSTEAQIARSVFGNTLPYGRIHVTDQLGFQDRAYTMNAGTGRDASFSLHVGPERYPGLQRTPELRSLMIHELTHVWQGVHSGWTPSFIFRSMFAQIARPRGRAYIYTPGEEWRTYNVEQQASIVEHWYGLGMHESDKRFRYIRDNIRTGTRR